MRRMFSENQLKNAAKEVIEAGTVENAKPIYWHGIDMYRAGETSLQGHILNNSATPIDSVAKFKAWIEGISGDVSFTVNGTVKIGNVSYSAFLLRKHGEGNTYSIYYKTDTGYTSANFNWEVIQALSDNVNKVN